MGSFRVDIEIGDPAGGRFESLRALVDTGATYTWVPRDILERLGIQPEEERPFVLADGRQVAYGIAWIRVRIDGRSQPTIAVFGDPGSEPVLGVFTLLLYVVVQQTESHVIVPVVMRRVVGLSPLIVVIALLVGGRLAGILGILLAVPLTTIVAELVDDFDKKKRGTMPE